MTICLILVSIDLLQLIHVWIKAPEPSPVISERLSKEILRRHVSRELNVVEALRQLCLLPQSSSEVQVGTIFWC